MADVIVKALKNGPYEISGGAKLVDHTGKGMPRALSIRSTFAAAARRKQNPSATTVTKISASKPKKPQAKKNPTLHHSIIPSFQLGRDELEYWSTGVMKKNETRFEPCLILGGKSYAR